MTHPTRQTALHAHYVDVIRHLEELILDRVPRLPLLPAPAPLTPTEVDRVAALFVAGHQLAAEHVRAHRAGG